MRDAYRKLWQFGTNQVERRFGWAVPLMLAPIVFLVLSGIQEIAAAFGASVFKQIVGAALVAVFVLAASLFWSVYVALWRGQTPWMKRRGAIASAIAWSIALWLLALSFFAPVTARLYDAHVVDVGDNSGLTHQPGDGGLFRTPWEFGTLYMWHTLEALPAIDAETLTIDPPVKHHKWQLGIALVLYKMAVLIPLVAVLRGVWVTRKTPIAEPGTGRALGT
jgi:hypothetical protein